MNEAAAGARTPMGVMVFGLARSGTTLVSDLLTIPGRSVVISEPEIFKHWSRNTAGRVHRLARLVGLEVGEEPPEAHLYGGSYARYFAEALVPRLNRLELWGIKNVDFSGWRQLLHAYPPRKLILCVRDLRDAAISGIDRICRLAITFRGTPYLRDEAWVLAGLAFSVHELMQMRKLPHLLVRYEDLATDPALRRRIADYVGLDRLQEERLNLKAAEMRRAWEVEKHGGGIGAASVGRFAAEPPGPVKALAERLWRLLPEYAGAFGYDAPPNDPALSDHDFALGPRTGAHPLRYLDTETWDWAGPRQFEPSFAQRRARIAAAKLVPPGAKVLELCSGAPAFARMLPADAELIHADAILRAPDFRIAALHDGELPSTEGFDLAAILGMLEHVGDPAAMLARLGRARLPAIVSYHAAEDTAGLDRRAVGWVSHLTRAELDRAFAAAGYAAESRWSFDGRQSLFRLSPRQSSAPEAGA